MLRLLLFTLMIFLVGISLFAQSGWFWQNPFPQGNHLYGVSAKNQSVAVAVGAYGTVMRTTNSGSSWKVFHSVGSTYADLLSVAFFNSTTGWAIGDSGVIIYTSDGGLNWVKQYSGLLRRKLRQLFILNSSTVFAVGDSGTILRTTNGGLNWLSISLQGIPKRNLNSIYFPTQTIGYIVGEGGMILKTTNGGSEWSKLESYVNGDLNSVYFKDVDTGWAVGSFIDSSNHFRQIIFTRNGGQNWYTRTAGSPLPPQKIRFLNNTDAIVIAGNYLFKSSDSGITWDVILVDTVNTFKDVSFFDSQTGWLVGSNGLILKTTDGGSNWYGQTHGTRSDLYCAHTGDNINLFAVGSEGTIVRATKDDLFWTSVMSPTQQSLHSIYFFRTNAACAVGNNGTILLTTNGLNWTIASSNTTSDLYSVCFSDSITGWALGLYGTVLHTTNAGNSWSKKNISGIDSSINLTDIFFADRQNGWITANFGLTRSFSKIFRTTNGGANWNLIKTDSILPILAIYFYNKDTGWAIGKTNIVMKTTNGGTEWSYQYIPSDQPSYFYDIKFINNSDGWLVSSNGNVYRTNNGGNKWYKQKSITKNALFSIIIDGSLKGWIVGANGTILKTTDGGGEIPTPPPPTPPSLQKPEKVKLLPNYPNPSRSRTNIAFHLEVAANVKLIIYDILGKKVKEIPVGDLQKGTYDGQSGNGPPVLWAGDDDYGNTVSSGIYICRLVSSVGNTTRKIVLVH